MATLWIWKVTWSTGIRPSPQHILAGDIDEALVKAKRYAPGFVPSVIRGLEAIGHIQVPDDLRDALVDCVEP